MVCINIFNVITTNKAYNKTSDYGNSDLALVVSPESKIRFLYKSDYAISQNNELLGLYYTNGIINNKLANVCITSFTDITKFFNITYTKTSNNIQNVNINKRVIVSNFYALNNDLKIDDELIIQIGPYSDSFTIVGISTSSSLFHNQDILLDESILNDFIIGYEHYYTTILIKLSDNNSIENAIDEINNINIQTKFKIINIHKLAYNIEEFGNIIPLILSIFITLIMGSILMFYIYQVHVLKIQHTIITFKTINLSSKKISYILLLELLIYLVIAFVLAIVPSYLISCMIYKNNERLLYILTHSKPYYLFSVFEGLLLIILGSSKIISNVCKKDVVSMQSEDHFEMKHPKTLFILFIISIIFFILTFLLNKIALLIISFIAIIVFILLIIFLYPYILSLFSLLKRKYSLPIKNVQKNKSLKNAAVFMIITISFLMIISSLNIFINKELQDTTEELRGVIQVQNVTNCSQELIDNFNNINNVNNATPYMIINNLSYIDKSITLIGCNDFQNLINTDIFNTQYLHLKNNEVCISKHLLRYFNLQIGDEFKLKIYDKTYDFIITNTHDKPNSLVFISLDPFDNSFNSISLQTSKSTSEDSINNIIKQINTEYSLKGYYVTSTSEVLGHIYNNIYSQLYTLRFFFYLMIIITPLAIFYCLYLSFVLKTKQIAILKSIGISYKEYLILTIKESLISLMCIICSSVILSLLMFYCTSKIFSLFAIYLSVFELINIPDMLVIYLVTSIIFIFLNIICSSLYIKVQLHNKE